MSILKGLTMSVDLLLNLYVHKTIILNCISYIIFIQRIGEKKQKTNINQQMNRLLMEDFSAKYGLTYFAEQNENLHISFAMDVINHSFILFSHM